MNDNKQSWLWIFSGTQYTPVSLQFFSEFFYGQLWFKKKRLIWNFEISSSDSWSASPKTR